MKIRLVTFSLLLAFAWLAVLVYTVHSGPVAAPAVWPTADRSDVPSDGHPAPLSEAEGWPLGMAP